MLLRVCLGARWSVDREWSCLTDGSWLGGQCCVSAVTHTACLKHKNQHFSLHESVVFLSKTLNNLLNCIEKSLQ